MADNKGTENDWFLVEATDCEETLEETSLGDLDNVSCVSDLSDLLDEAPQSQGNSLELFHKQESLESEQELNALKRKLLYSPQARSADETDIASISPRLETISITKQDKKRYRRQLFSQDDSGLELSLLQDETENIDESTQVDQQQKEHTGEVGAAGVDILKASNIRAALLSRFKDTAGVSFTDLTRSYKSNKTCCGDWVLAVWGVRENLIDSVKELLQTHCVYIQLEHAVTEKNRFLFLLVRFKAQKSRETVIKLITTILPVDASYILSEPPKSRSVAAALFWYKRSMSSTVFTWGTTLEWIAQQTLINHQLDSEKPFELCKMVQWAYDNGHTEECKIAYYYAVLADEDENARAFLSSNSQAKYVKDCAQMVRHYLRAEMAQMSMSEWIFRKLDNVEGSGNWKEIVRFLRFQEVEFISFMIAFKDLLCGKPKKNCLLIFGPPNTGKSMFCTSLLKLLGGKVISYCNSKSQFWLQPLADAKIGLLDDATKPCWDYMDTYMRNALDGNTICIDLKHRAPQQIKCPPLLITSNIDVKSDTCWMYLHSRISAFKFAHEFPFKDNGDPGFSLTDENWKSFFERFWQQLELSDQEDEGNDGKPQQSLRLTARAANEPI